MEQHRFSRTELLIGPEGVLALSRKRVAIFGLGGVGSFCAEALARAGIGALDLVDFDDVNVTNINRQLVATELTIGRPKVDVMKERIASVNPDCIVRSAKVFFSRDNAHELLAPGLDYVADAIDSIHAKLDLIETCMGLGIPVASSMGAGNKMDPSRFKVADISNTDTCPLARAVRTGLRKRGIDRGLNVVYSTEPPMRVAPGPPGSISFVPPVAGLMLAGLIVNDILRKNLLTQSNPS